MDTCYQLLKDHRIEPSPRGFHATSSNIAPLVLAAWWIWDSESLLQKRWWKHSLLLSCVWSFKLYLIVFCGHMATHILQVATLSSMLTLQKSTPTCPTWHHRADPQGDGMTKMIKNCRSGGDWIQKRWTSRNLTDRQRWNLIASITTEKL